MQNNIPVDKKVKQTGGLGELNSSVRQQILKPFHVCTIPSETICIILRSINMHIFN